MKHYCNFTMEHPLILNNNIPSDVLVRLDNIYKQYQSGEQKQEVLSGLTLDIKRGEYVALIGPSGSGKSTLMNIVGCLDKATSGKFVFDGVDIHKDISSDKLSEIRSDKIGFIFQNYSLFPKSSTIDNVKLPLIYKKTSKKLRNKMALSALNKVGLDEKTKHFPFELSGGQQQRVAIARALVKKPELILADEPTGNLDAKNTEIIMELFDLLHKEGHTIFIITHDLEVANRSQRIITMQNGRAQ